MRVGAACIGASVLVTLIGALGTAGSLQRGLHAAGPAALDPAQKSQTISSSLSSAHWFTSLGLGVGSVLFLAGLVALGVALERSLAAARARHSPPRQG